MLYEKNLTGNLEDKSFLPPITILVPCYNEEKTIHNTLNSLTNLHYPNYLVIFINDGSRDNTASIIESFIKDINFFYFLDLKENIGKAAALNKALTYVNTKYVLVLDADTTLDEKALMWLVQPFRCNKKVGAVTGNVLVSNKINFLSRFQSAEFTCIIGLIKRFQQIFGRLFTVSGCITMFNMYALRKVGFFSSQTATEDVDITWRIQRKFYKVLFEPRAICYIQAPLGLSQYIKQRKRWALGGWHLLRQHYNVFRDYRIWDLWVIYIEFVLSCIWAFLFIGGLFILIIINIIYSPSQDLLLKLCLSSSVISFIFFIQAAISIFTNQKYDKELLKYGLWICWYPLLFFLIGSILILFTMYKGLFVKSDSMGKWDSPLRF